MDPNNAEAAQGKQKAAMAEAGYGMSAEERREAGMQDPEVQEILRDPVMQSILQQMQSDPGAAQKYVADAPGRFSFFIFFIGLGPFGFGTGPFIVCLA